MPEHPQLRFRKSSYSAPNSNNCVEVVDLSGGAGVRDSQRPEAGHLAFPRHEWRAFLDAVLRQEL